MDKLIKVLYTIIYNSSKILRPKFAARWLDECPAEFKPLVYRRYVADTFLIFRSMDHVPLFLAYMNSKHRNIEFTSETEVNGKLAFLDISISQNRILLLLRFIENQLSQS